MTCIESNTFSTFHPLFAMHNLMILCLNPAFQIKVRNFANCSVTMAPAEFASWADARSELMVEAKVR